MGAEQTPRVVRRRPGQKTFESLDEVAARHAALPPPQDEGPAPAPVEPAASAPPPISRLASKVELEGQEAVPSDDPPHRRSHPTMDGGVEAIEDAPVAPDDWDGEFRTLEDLLWRFPIGDGTGQYYLHVQRVKPTMLDGKPIAGVLRPCYDRISQVDFVELYGGGIYHLMVYGPPKRRNLLNHATTSGAPQPRPMLKRPVIYTVPWDADAGGYPPNVDAAWMHDPGDIRYMLNQGAQRPFNRAPGSADAAILRSELEHAEKREIRQSARREEERREKQRETLGAIDAVRAAHEGTVEVLREQLKDRSARQPPPANPLDGLGEVLQVLKPTEDLARIRELHANDLKAQEQRHRDEIAALRAEHERERNSWTVEKQGFDLKQQTLEERLDRRERDLMERSERVAKEARDDASKRVRDAEEAADRRVRTVEESARREIEALRAELERQLSHQKGLFEMRLADAERERARAIEARDLAHRATESALTSTATTEKAMLQSTLSNEKAILQAEIERYKADNAKLQKLLDEKEDLPGQVERFGQMAETLGYAKASEGGEEPKPDKWAMVTAIAQQVAQNLPDMIRGITEAASQRRQGPAPQVAPAVQPRQLAPQPQQRPVAPRRPVAFATEEAGMGSMPPAYSPTPHQVSAPPPQPMPQPAPMPHIPVHVPMQPMAQPLGFGDQPPPQPTYPPAPLPQPGMAPPPVAAPPESLGSGVDLPRAPERPARKKKAAAAAAAQPPMAPLPDGPVLSDDAILSKRKELEQAYNTGTTPEQVAELIALTAGGDLAIIVRSVHPARVMRIVQGTEDGMHSPLVRKSGQMWLTEIHAHLSRKLREQTGT